MSIAMSCTLAFKYSGKDAIPLRVMADKGAAWGEGRAAKAIGTGFAQECVIADKALARVNEKILMRLSLDSYWGHTENKRIQRKI